MPEGIDRGDIYLKNAVVALVSAKINNPNSDVALVTNIEVATRFVSILSKYNVLIYKEPFDLFLFDDNYKWGLAFYKLCALKKMLSKGYSNYLLLDTDTFTQSSLDDLWIEANSNIMLYDTNQRLSLKNYKRFTSEVERFYGEYTTITQYGGEFIAGNKDNLCAFIEKCCEIYNEMIQRGFITNCGDEFIISVAANLMRNCIKGAGGYVFRFWTGEFRLVSTCYEYDPVSVLHVPSQKTTGMVKLFDLISAGVVLKNNRVHRILHLSKPRWQNVVKKLFGRASFYQ